METWPPPCRPAGPGAGPTGPMPSPCPSTSSRPMPPRLRTGTGRGSPPADLDALPPDSILRTFHPAVAGWFLGRFPGGPTEPQRAAWPHIAEGGDVLVASPTGTGKTLTGFLVAIDAAYRAAAEAGRRPPARPPARRSSTSRRCGPWPSTSTRTSRYRWPESRAEAARRGCTAPDLSVAVRTGDTPAAERAAMRAVAPRPARHHARVALPPADGPVVPGGAAAACTP